LREVERLRADLVHLAVLLRLFDPGTDPDEIAPRRRHRRIAYFAKGELSKRVYDAIRNDRTTSADELAATSMAEKHVPTTDWATRRLFASKFHSALHNPATRPCPEDR
jgi:hypothetical protein